jgi:hypothetical protein
MTSRINKIFRAKRLKIEGVPAMRKEGASCMVNLEEDESVLHNPHELLYQLNDVVV